MTRVLKEWRLLFALSTDPQHPAHIGPLHTPRAHRVHTDRQRSAGSIPRLKYFGWLQSSKSTSTRPMDCSRDWKVLSKSSEPRLKTKTTVDNGSRSWSVGSRSPWEIRIHCHRTSSRPSWRLHQKSPSSPYLGRYHWIPRGRLKDTKTHAWDV